MKLRIIFLDIDGVLLTHRFSFQPGNRGGRHRPADPEAVAALNRIVTETGAKIVVSSTWRYGSSRVQLQELLCNWGVVATVMDKTPNLAVPVGTGALVGTMHRGTEIAAWLTGQEDLGRHKIESFVILDDDADMEPLMGRLIQTNFTDGLLMAHAERAIEMLR